MNFSEIFKQCSHSCKFSPDGSTVANAFQHRLLIRDVKTLEVLQNFNCLDEIEALEWAPDSSLILCVNFKKSRLQVWSLDDPAWICKIDEGSSGLIDFKWTPDSRHILSTADFHIRVTVWSLVNKNVFYMKYPKAVSQNMTFTHTGDYLALLERRECKDHVTIFSCNTWQLVKHFEPNTVDAVGISFAPAGHCMCIWEALFEYKILLYSLSGHCMASFTTNSDSLGIKSVSWSPSSQFLAVGGFDQKTRVLNHIIWRPVAEYCNKESITNPNVIVYKEVEKPWGYDRGLRLESCISAKYEVVTDRPLTIPVTKQDGTKQMQKIGVSVVEFSPDNRYLMTRNDNMPTSLWIWSMEELTLLTVLTQIKAIKCAEWHPQQAQLALCTGSNKIYLWTVEGCTAVEVPNQVTFEVSRLKWHPHGKALLLLGKEQMCFCFLDV